MCLFTQSFPNFPVSLNYYRLPKVSTWEWASCAWQPCPWSLLVTWTVVWWSLVSRRARRWSRSTRCALTTPQTPFLLPSAKTSPLSTRCDSQRLTSQTGWLQTMHAANFATKGIFNSKFQFTASVKGALLYIFMCSLIFFIFTQMFLFRSVKQLRLW